MRFSAVSVTLALLAATSKAFTVHPVGLTSDASELPYGMRIVPIDNLDLNEATAAQPFKRDGRNVACACIPLNHDDCNAATHGLEAWAGNGQYAEPGHCFVQRVNSIMAFW
ncbi:hypothetical protein PG987_000106 [Apiospora arundinis]